MGTVMNQSVAKERKKNIFELHPKKTIVLFILLFFVVVELSGQIIYYFSHQRTFIFTKADFANFTPYGLIHYKPNTTIRLPGYPGSLETDQYGFVHNGYKKEISHDQYLIFLVGGSCAEGRGSSSNATTIAADLERLLNGLAGKERFRVVNAGLAGHVSYQQLCLIEGEIVPKFQPQMIIALDGHNDGWYAVSWEQWRPNWQPYFDQITRDINRNLEPGFGILTDLIKRHSVIAASFDKIGKKIFPWNDHTYTQRTAPPEARLETAAKDYLANHRIAKERLELQGIKYYVFLQPILARFLKREIRPDEAQIMQKWGADYQNSDIFFLGMEKFYSMVSREGQDLAFFNDLSKQFWDTREKIYVDHCHFNDAGNLMIAQSLARRLWPELAKVQ
jgi:hypothetical protein